MYDCAKKYYEFLDKAEKLREKRKELYGEIIRLPWYRTRRINLEKYKEVTLDLDNLIKRINEMEQIGCIDKSVAEEMRLLIDEVKEKPWWITKVIERAYFYFRE